MKDEVFEVYNKSKYIKWHKEVVENIELENEIDKLRKDLKISSDNKLKTLAQLLTQIKERTESECKLKTHGLLRGNFTIPIEDFSMEKSPDKYDLLFKSTNSIIEKIWRKNAQRKEKYVSLTNIKEKIKDLIRTSIICPTLMHAEMFSERLGNWKDYIPKYEIDNHFSDVDRVEVDKEAKPASGYFAYHALVYFTDGLAIEVQLYSQLSAAWRTMSHKIYENSRIGSSAFLTPNSPESRLISLGHLLHLAEYELRRLAQEL